MSSLPALARLLILVGAALLVLGIGIFVLGKVGRGAWFGLPRLPGDVLIERRNVVVYVPVVSALLVSVILTIVLGLFLRR